jgi:transcriptional regulator with XRE-family HTH domain
MIRPKPKPRKRPPLAPLRMTGTDGRQLAAALKNARKAKGLVQMELAGKVGTTKSAISRLEHGKGDLRLSTLRKLAAALGLRLNITLT